MDSRRIVLWIIVGGATLLFVFMSLASPLRRQPGVNNAALSSPVLGPSPVSENRPDDRQDTDLIQNSVVSSEEYEVAKREFSPLSPPDQASIETHRKLVVSFNREIREATGRMYEGAFQQLRLPGVLQEKVIDILTKQQKQLEQQAFDSAQSGNIPAPPSPEEMRSQQALQDQQLRSVLGDAGLAAFNQYRATIPDRTVISTMTEQGANLSESQSEQLLQILVHERQQIQANTIQNLNSMPPAQAIRAIDQQQLLLQQAVSDRVQSILTPEQATMLKGVLSQQLRIGPRLTNPSSNDGHRRVDG
jgi:hypothetical protein